VYLDGISQVKAPRWTSGRCAMVEDAAYCPTPMTGMGTSLSIISAYILAGELSRHNDHKDEYETALQVPKPERNLLQVSMEKRKRRNSAERTERTITDNTILN